MPGTFINYGKLSFNFYKNYLGSSCNNYLLLVNILIIWSGLKGGNLGNGNSICNNIFAFSENAYLLEF